MKKLFLCLLTLAWGFVGVACYALNDSSERQSTSNSSYSEQQSISSSSQTEIVYEEKYICGLDIGEPPAKQRYYIIYNDGTAEYHYYNAYYDPLQLNDYAISSYTIYLKYEFDEENSMYCFYDGDGIIYDSADNKGEKNHAFYVKIIYDRDFLEEEDGDLYVSEEYLIENPNFGK